MRKVIHTHHIQVFDIRKSHMPEMFFVGLSYIRLMIVLPLSVANAQKTPQGVGICAVFRNIPNQPQKSFKKYTKFIKIQRIVTIRYAINQSNTIFSQDYYNFYFLFGPMHMS